MQVIFEYNLDFDDAYQYVAAEKYDHTIIGCDSDPSRTPRWEKVLQEISREF